MWTTSALWMKLCTFTALQVWKGSDGELVLLVTLTRHGSRAPNSVMWELCPANEANRLAYNVPPGQLTAKGMQEAYKLGAFIRKTYVNSMDFLPPTLGDGRHGNFSSEFMSDPAERCLQTAQVMAQGLLPNGTGPPGYPNQPVAVQTEQPPFANLLAAAMSACLSKQKADNKVFDESRGEEIISSNKNVTDTVAEACGTSVEDYAKADGGQSGLVLAVKDVGDMLDFDEQQGLPRLESISKETHANYSAMAFTLLQERYFSSKKQVAYWAGDLPFKLLDHFQHASELRSMGLQPERLFFGYHGHRELLYALAHLLGWKFDVPGMPTALGMSAIPPATTMFFELHHHSNETDEPNHKSNMNSGIGHGSIQDGQDGEEEQEGYYIRTYTWTPQFGQQETVLNVCSDAEPGKGCPLNTLQDAVLDGMIDTGSWQDICHHVPFSEAEEIAKATVYGEGGSADAGQDEQPTPLSTRLSAVAVTIASAALLLLFALYVKDRWFSTHGHRGEEYEIVP